LTPFEFSALYVPISHINLTEKKGSHWVGWSRASSFMNAYICILFR